MRPLGSSSQLSVSHTLNSKGENTVFGTSLAVEDSSTILGLEEEVLVKVHVSCFHEFEGPPSCWPDEPVALRRIILELVSNSPPYEVIMGDFSYWHWDRWSLVVAQGLTFLETDNRNLVVNAIAMGMEHISLSMAPQLLSKVTQTTGRLARKKSKQVC